MHMDCCNQNQKYDSQRSVYLRWHIEEARAVYIILLMLHYVLDDQNFPYQIKTLDDSSSLFLYLHVVETLLKT